MYSNEYEEEQEQETKGSFIMNFYNNNKVLVWIFAGIIIFILLMSILTKGGSNNKNNNINYDVTIVPEGDVFVLLGKSTNLLASVKNDTKAEIVWSVEDETIAKVDNGNVIGLDYGTTKVMATYIDSKNEKHTDFRKVIVAAGDPSITLTDVSFKDGDLFMPLNSTYTISLSLVPPRGYVESEKFTSSNTSVVTVDNKGVVTSVGEGSAVITFDVNNEFKKELNVYVDRDFNKTEIVVTPSKIMFDGELRKIKIGTTEKLSYTVEPENAAVDKFTWESSNENVLTVDQNGRIKGISEGTASVTVTALNGTKDRIDVEVESDIVEVTDINLSISDFYLTVGQSQIILPIVSPANASNKALSYMSLDGSVAYVTPNETGTQATITGINAGSTTIVVKSFNGIEKRLNVVVTGGNNGGNNGGNSGGSSSSSQGFKISSKDANDKGFIYTSYEKTRPANQCATGPVTVTVEKTDSSVNKLVIIVCSYSDSTTCGKEIKRYETTSETSFRMESTGDYVIRVEEYNSSDKKTRTRDKFICIDGSSESSSISSKKLYDYASESKSHPYAKGTTIKFTAPSDVSYIKVCWDPGICAPASAANKITTSRTYSFSEAGTYAVRVAKYYSNSSSPTIETLGFFTIADDGGEKGTVSIKCDKTTLKIGESTTCTANLSSGDSVKEWKNLTTGAVSSKKTNTISITSSNAGTYKWRVTTNKGATAEVTITFTQSSSNNDNSDSSLTVILPSGTQSNTIHTSSTANKFFNVETVAKNIGGKVQVKFSSQSCIEFDPGSASLASYNLSKGESKKVWFKYKNKGNSTVTISFTPSSSSYSTVSKTINIVCE